MISYQTNKNKLSGARYAEVRNQALFIFNQIKRKTKRKPYIRSAYFNKQKIFFDYFWAHLFQKRPRERIKRLKYFEVAIDLLRNSKNHPFSKENPHKQSEMFHRFKGITKNKEQFWVQVKEDKQNNKKYFMSCFPAKSK